MSRVSALNARKSCCRWIVGTLIAVGVWISLSDAYAQDTAPNTAFQVQQFRPWADPQGVFQTQSGATLGQWNYFVGVWLNYAKDTMVLRRADGTSSSVLDHQLGLDIIGAVGLLNWLDFGFNFPMTLYQIGTIPNLSLFEDKDRNTSLSGFALSDIKLFLKAQALREDKHGVNLGAQVYVGFPSGDQTKMNGENGVSFGAQLNLSKHISVVNLGLNLGYRYLPPTTLANLKLEHEITYSLGAGIRLVQTYLDLLIDLAGAVAISDVTTVNLAPFELFVGIRAFPLNNEDLALTLGGALSITSGYGSPQFRALLGIVWSPKRRDQDGDGIIDRKDRCPKTPGPRENQGCPWPDTDGDGLTDNIDKCPKVPGPKENQGCPWGDKDGDGLTDNIDKCPEKAGPKENKGCPWGDKDGDGLTDNVDKCPDKAGPKENQGCPWPDTDGDGLTDNIDKCPRKKGPKENNGCPDLDRDNDGIIDRLDKCPDIPGAKAAGGCPKKVVVQITKKEIKILQKIEFAFNRAVIRRRSYVILDQVVSVLKSRPQLRIRIEGHTDNVGGKKYNLRLSKRRAKSVYQYLVKKGIAAERLSSEGYGMSVPLVPNTSKENRAKNRRVQFQVLNKNSDVKTQ